MLTTTKNTLCKYPSSTLTLLFSGNHLDNFINREELKYKGNITIIKINGEVPVETVEVVNKISKFVEGRREVDNVGKGKISKDKGRVGIIFEVL